jgi:superfamily II DNA/RNA helicase
MWAQGLFGNGGVLPKTQLQLDGESATWSSVSRATFDDEEVDSIIADDIANRRDKSACEIISLGTDSGSLRQRFLVSPSSVLERREISSDPHNHLIDVVRILVNSSSDDRITCATLEVVSELSRAPHGILLYHEAGTGKTLKGTLFALRRCVAMGLEGVLVLTSKSIAQQFRSAVEGGITHGRLLLDVGWIEVREIDDFRIKYDRDRERITEEIGKRVVVIDEAHNNLNALRDEWTGKFSGKDDDDVFVDYDTDEDAPDTAVQKSEEVNIDTKGDDTDEEKRRKRGRPADVGKRRGIDEGVEAKFLHKIAFEAAYVVLMTATPITLDPSRLLNLLLIINGFDWTKVYTCLDLPPALSCADFGAILKDVSSVWPTRSRSLRKSLQGNATDVTIQDVVRNWAFAMGFLPTVRNKVTETQMKYAAETGWAVLGEQRLAQLCSQMLLGKISFEAKDEANYPKATFLRLRFRGCGSLKASERIVKTVDKLPEHTPFHLQKSKSSKKIRKRAPVTVDDVAAEASTAEGDGEQETPVADIDKEKEAAVADASLEFVIPSSKTRFLLSALRDGFKLDGEGNFCSVKRDNIAVDIFVTGTSKVSPDKDVDSTFKTLSQHLCHDGVSTKRFPAVIYMRECQTPKAIEVVKLFREVFSRVEHIQGNVSSEQRTEMTQRYNSGEVDVLFISEAGVEGLDLKGTALVALLDCPRHIGMVEQIFGRGIRNGSHVGCSFDRVICLELYMMPDIPGAKTGLDAQAWYDRKGNDAVNLGVCQILRASSLQALELLKRANDLKTRAELERLIFGGERRYRSLVKFEDDKVDTEDDIEETPQDQNEDDAPEVAIADVGSSSSSLPNVTLHPPPQISITPQLTENKDVEAGDDTSSQTEGNTIDDSTAQEDDTRSEDDSTTSSSSSSSGGPKARAKASSKPSVKASAKPSAKAPSKPSTKASSKAPSKASSKASSKPSAKAPSKSSHATDLVDAHHQNEGVPRPRSSRAKTAASAKPKAAVTAKARSKPQSPRNTRR